MRLIILLIYVLVTGCEGRALQYLRSDRTTDQFATDEMHCEQDNYHPREPFVFTIHPESSIGFSGPYAKRPMYLDMDWEAFDRCMLTKGWRHP